MRGWKATVAIAVGRDRHSRRDPLFWPRKHSDGKVFHDPLPLVPAVKACQVVRAHQPDKLCRWVQMRKLCQRLRGVSGADARFDVRDGNARVLHDLASGRQSMLQGRRAVFLQRVSGGHQPPDLIQIKAPKRLIRDVDMTFVRRIKGTAEQTDPGTGTGDRNEVA